MHRGAARTHPAQSPRDTRSDAAHGPKPLKPIARIGRAAQANLTSGRVGCACGCGEGFDGAKETVGRAGEACERKHLIALRGSAFLVAGGKYEGFTCVE